MRSLIVQCTENNTAKAVRNSGFGAVIGGDRPTKKISRYGHEFG